ncbi:unnamed protein product, partial [Meganyctiphanes norvegica]
MEETVVTEEEPLKSGHQNNVMEDITAAEGRSKGDAGVLTLNFLKDALHEQHPQYPVLTHTNASQVCSHVTNLSLQFKGLGSLNFLWMFKSLTRLELSNNHLSDTKGLEKLENLTWLDLSYNQIRRVVGLTELVQLEVLVLHNNLLQELDRAAFNRLNKLQVLTLANNR